MTGLPHLDCLEMIKMVPRPVWKLKTMLKGTFFSQSEVSPFISGHRLITWILSVTSLPWPSWLWSPFYSRSNEEPVKLSCFCVARKFYKILHTIYYTHRSVLLWKLHWLMLTSQPLKNDNRVFELPIERNQYSVPLRRLDCRELGSQAVNQNNFGIACNIYRYQWKSGRACLSPPSQSDTKFFFCHFPCQFMIDQNIWNYYRPPPPVTHSTNSSDQSSQVLLVQMSIRQPGQCSQALQFSAELPIVPFSFTLPF